MRSLDRNELKLINILFFGGEAYGEKILAVYFSTVSYLERNFFVASFSYKLARVESDGHYL